MMKETVSKKEIREFNFYGGIFSVLLLGTVVTVAPLAYFLGVYGIAITCVLFTITMIFAFKVEGYKNGIISKPIRKYLHFVMGSVWMRLPGNRRRQNGPIRTY